MEGLKIILKRLAKPKVAISILSQIATILIIFNVHIDMNVFTALISSIFSVFVTLGIISDPDSKTIYYRDDFLRCNNCDKLTKHVEVNGQMVCKNCGCVHCDVSK